MEEHNKKKNEEENIFVDSFFKIGGSAFLGMVLLLVIIKGFHYFNNKTGKKETQIIRVQVFLKTGEIRTYENVKDVSTSNSTVWLTFKDKKINIHNADVIVEKSLD